jgi:hypothetical protein
VRLSGLGRQQGPSPDGITPAILKQLASVVKVPLTVVFNLSLSAGVFLLFFLYSKAAISVMCPVITEYRSCQLFRNDSRKWYAIGKLPSFVLSGRSTVSNLVQFTNGVIGEIEDGLQVDGVYTDFSKDFDRVLHGLLKFNFSILFDRSLLCWMGSHLTGLQMDRIKS